MMRGLKIAAVMFFAAAAFTTASAQLKIGFVNSEKIFTQFEGTRVAQEQFNREVARWEQEASRRTREITELRNQLEAQSLLLSADRRKTLEDSLRQMIITHERFLQEKFGQRGEVLTKNEELTRPILEKIQRIIDRIAADEQFDFIFDWRAGGLVFAKDAYDLTDRVLAQLARER
ncbi:MAG: OmpH family outer membrane protein [Chitinispirillales bacterium]|jgi:outer membrane protein|nr:OmpH family outer membrane protein [Chitinispirillales bacterium]